MTASRPRSSRDSVSPQAEAHARLERLERRLSALTDFVVPAYWDLLDLQYGQRSPTSAPACPACAGKEMAQSARLDRCAFGGGMLQRLECAACGCVFGPQKYLDLPPSLVELDYRLLYTLYAEGDSTEAEIRAFHTLEPRPDGVYLNWGSGAWSSSVTKLRAEGWDVWGFEPFASEAQPFVATAKDQISARFDGVFSNNVIEHLLSPADQFREFARYLKPGGRMCHASPCYEWSYAHSRFHVFFPLREAPMRLAARTGFELLGGVDDGEFHARVFRLLEPDEREAEEM